MDFTVREANIDDLDGVAKLWRKLSIDQLSKDKLYKGSLEFNSGNNQMKNSILNQDCGLFIVEYDNKIQGFVEVWVNRSDFKLEKNDSAYVVHYYLDESGRRVKEIISILYNLFKIAENWAKEKGKHYLVSDAFEHNQRIIKLLSREHMYVYKTRMVRKI